MVTWLCLSEVNALIPTPPSVSQPAVRSRSAPLTFNTSKPSHHNLFRLRLRGLLTFAFSTPFGFLIATAAPLLSCVASASWSAWALTALAPVAAQSGIDLRVQHSSQLKHEDARKDRDTAGCPQMSAIRLQLQHLR